MNASFRSRGLIKSGPQALLGFNIDKTSSTSVWLISISQSWFSGSESSGSTASESSRSVCIAKKLLNSFALSKSLKITLLFFSSGGMPSFYSRNLVTSLPPSSSRRMIIRQSRYKFFLIRIAGFSY